MIEVKNVYKIFKDDYILENINFKVNEGEKIGIVGVNGSGKSTLVKCMIFDDYLTSGEVNIKGSIGYIDQSPIFIVKILKVIRVSNFHALNLKHRISAFQLNVSTTV